MPEGRNRGFAEVNGARLYHETVGEGEPLVLVHAGIADGRMWDGQLGAFARRYRVIRHGMRGFGRSAMVKDRSPIMRTYTLCSTPWAPNGRSSWAARWEAGRSPTSRSSTRNGSAP